MIHNRDVGPGGCCRFTPLVHRNRCCCSQSFLQDISISDKVKFPCLFFSILKSDTRQRLKQVFGKLEASPQVTLLLPSASKREAALPREAKPKANELVGPVIDCKGENAI